MKIFNNIRNIMIKSVVLNGTTLEEKNLERNFEFKGPVYFDDSGKSFL